MIVRILGSCASTLRALALGALNGLDTQLEQAVESGDEEMFRTALHGLLSAVRASGTHHAPDTLDESDLILPPPDATIDEVRELLGDDGLIPG